MAEQKKRPEQTWEEFTEAKIRDAQDGGHFDYLPGFGKPIAGIDEPHDENWWIREKLKRERLSHLPPSLAIKRDIELTLESIQGFVVERDVRREISRLNDRIREANYKSVWGPPSSTMPLDVEDVIASWRAHRTTQAKPPNST